MSMKIKNLIKLILSILVSGGLIFFVYRKVAFSEAVKILKFLDLQFFSALIALMLIQLSISALRWKLLLKSHLDGEISFTASLIDVWGSLTPNLFIPGKFGELIRLKWCPNIPFSKGIPLLILEKVWDMQALFFYILIGSLVLCFQSPTSFYYASAFLSLFIYPILTILLVRHAHGLIQKLIHKFYKKFDLSLVKPQTKPFLVKSSLLSLCLWLIQLFQFSLFFNAINIELSFPVLMYAIPLGLIAGQVPVTIMGTGSRDMALAFLLSKADIATEQVLLISLFCLFRITLISILGAPCFFYRLKKEHF